MTPHEALSIVAQIVDRVSMDGASHRTAAQALDVLRICVSDASGNSKAKTPPASSQPAAPTAPAPASPAKASPAKR